MSSTELSAAASATLNAALSYLARGWKIIPVHRIGEDGACSCGSACKSPGKHPMTQRGILDASGDSEQIRRWFGGPHPRNIGIATGSKSGIVVVDVDPRNGGERPEGLAETYQVLTGGGGTHDYFKIPPGVSVRSRVLAAGVDLKAEGGYVLAPPSNHASGRSYVLEFSSPDDLAEAPPEIVGGPDDAERAANAAAVPAGNILSGARNVALAKIAGSLRRHGSDADSIATILAVVNARRCVPPLEADEVERIARSVSRYAPVPDAPAGTSPLRDAGSIVGGAAEPIPATERKVVLVPGRHEDFQADGTPFAWRVYEDEFARAVVAGFPPGVIYRRGGIAGVVSEEGTFEPISAEAAILLVAQFFALESRKVKRQGQSLTLEVRPEPVSEGRARLVLAAAAQDAPEIRRVVSHPVFVGDDLRLIESGYDESSGTMVVPTGVAIGDAPRAPLDVFRDALGDWPWKDEADLATAVGLLLTHLLRPAIAGNVPLFLVQATQERTGKTLFAADFIGGLLAGRPMALTQLADDEAEVEKRITALVVAGRTAITLDNISRRLDSASIAALLTADVWEGRILGSSRMFRARPEMILVATGNNVAASSEIAKRIVSIRLESRVEDPESRTDFRWPSIPDLLAARGPEVLGALVGMVRAWDAAGRPGGRSPLGGFGAWASMVGGILELAGFAGWHRSSAEWRSEADSDGEERRALVSLWALEHGSDWISSRDVVALARRADVCAWATESKSDASAAMRIGRLLSRDYVGRRIAGFVVRRAVRDNMSRWRIESADPGRDFETPEGTSRAEVPLRKSLPDADLRDLRDLRDFSPNSNDEKNTKHHTIDAHDIGGPGEKSPESRKSLNSAPGKDLAQGTSGGTSPGSPGDVPGAAPVVSGGAHWQCRSNIAADGSQIDARDPLARAADEDRIGTPRAGEGGAAGRAGAPARAPASRAPEWAEANREFEEAARQFAAGMGQDPAWTLRTLRTQILGANRPALSLAEGSLLMRWIESQDWRSIAGHAAGGNP